jgi:hypothetical protein
MKSELQKNYKTLINFKVQLLNYVIGNIQHLFDFILYLSKVYPWWLEKILNFKLNKVKFSYCKTYQNILNTLKTFHDHSDNPEYIQLSSELFKKITQPGKIIFPECFVEINKDALTSRCLLEEPVEDDYLVEYITKSSDDDDYSKEQELTNLENTELKYKITSSIFLNKLTSLQTANTLTDLINSRRGEETDEYIVNMPITEGLKERYNLLIRPRKREAVQKETAGGSSIFVGGTIPEIETNISSKNDSSLQERGEIQLEQLHNGRDSSSEFSKNLTDFYQNSYKCNVGNRVKNYVDIIDEIQKEYGMLSDKPVNIEEDENKILLIKIFMKNIDFINKSFVPNINYNTIIEAFTKVDNSYTVQQMYSIINDIHSSVFTCVELSNLLYDSISDATLNDLDIPYLKYELQKKIVSIIEEDTPLDLPIDLNEESIEQTTEQPVENKGKGENIVKGRPLAPFEPPNLKPTRQSAGTYKNTKAKQFNRTKRNKQMKGGKKTRKQKVLKQRKNTKRVQ